MAWIKTIASEDAEGLLRRLYDAALKRTGKIFNVIRLQSLRPQVLRASTQLYTELMHGRESGLTRVEREMIATVVSHSNACFY